MVSIFIYENFLRRSHKDTEKYIEKSISSYLCTPCPYTISRYAGGKPYIDGNPLYISASHTENTLVTGVSDAEFGIDAEFLTRKIKNYIKIAEKYFTEKEIGLILSQPPERRQETFIRLWVKKEAYIKLKGKSILSLKKATVSDSEFKFKTLIYKDLIICLCFKNDADTADIEIFNQKRN